MGIDYPEMTFCEFSLGVDKIKAWDVDLKEFLNDVEDDPDAATMLGTANEFDLDASGIIEEESNPPTVAVLSRKFIMAPNVFCKHFSLLPNVGFRAEWKHGTSI